MFARFLFVTVCACVCAGIASPFAQTDLDALMQRVLSRRDDNWKKLQQYVLNERESLQVTGPGAQPIYGMRNEYLWFPQAGTFVRSPLSANGVTIGEDERRRAEALWVAREERREKRRAAGNAGTDASLSIGSGGVNMSVESAMRDAFEPGFVSSAYFLKFKFDSGHYALVGRDKYGDKDVLKIEYYPSLMFKEGRVRPNKEVRKRSQDVERQMNKVALVTLWVLPDEQQIVKYEFTNIDMDFLPAAWLVRMEGLTARMEMGQPFPGVWLPRLLEIGFDMTLAIGEVDGRFSSEYYDYRLATVTTRIR
jgi:hypothetical protein